MNDARRSPCPSVTIPKARLLSVSGIKPQSRSLKLLTCALVVIMPLVYFAQSVARENGPSVQTTGTGPISIFAEHSQDWRDGKTFITILRGRCRITQGGTSIQAGEMVVWENLDTEEGRQRITLFLAGDVRLEEPGRTLTERSMLLDLKTTDEVTFDVKQRIVNRPGTADGLFRRAEQRRTRYRHPLILQTQFRAPGPGDAGTTPSGPSLAPFPKSGTIQLEPPQAGVRRYQVSSRSLVPYNFQSFTSHDTEPAEQVSIVTGGVNVQIEGMQGSDGRPLGPVDLSADRVVIWTQSPDDQEFSPIREQSSETPLKFYLEGNVVVRQGIQVIQGERGFYDARAKRSFMLNVELRTKIPKLKNDVRVRARTLRQLAEDSFHAQGAWITTSEFGKPGYRIQASDIFLDPRPVSSWFDGQSLEFDPETGIPTQETQLWATTQNNTFFLDDFPVFYWPYLSFPAQNPEIPLTKLSYQGDSVFGSQIYTGWDMFMLLGMEQPEDMRWDLQLNYFSERGPSAGTFVDYKGSNLFNIEGFYSGESTGFYIQDSGLDNLGRGRRSIPLETKQRGRILMRHRHTLPYSLSFLSEVGYLSDYNFQEQYFEDDFDEGKDNETYSYLKQQSDSWAWSVTGRSRLNDFYTQSEWLPRADLYTLSEPLFGGAVTWTQHSWLANAHLRPAVRPLDPAIAPAFNALPWDTDSQGTIASTKHQLDVPFNLGPVVVVPYALGEVTHWEEDPVGDQLTRLYGSAGLRSSVLFTKFMPGVQSDIFNLNGLVHKSLFSASYSFSESNTDLAAVPIYNEFNDNSQEQFTRRLITNTYGGVLPGTVDPRFYALRSGTGQAVTAPYHELVDDQQVARLAWRNRWQTKVGPIDSPRIKDWMTLDFETSFFPDADRDNFGEDFGLFGTRYQWNIGDRTSLFAGAAWDLFDTGQQLWDAGILTQRSQRGSLFAGIRQIKNSTGLDSQILTLSMNYTMSPKWRSTIATAYDIGENQDRGQSLTLTRLGRDFNLRIGTSYNPSKNTTRFGVSVEPRFIRLGVRNVQLDSLDGSGGTRR